LIILDYLIADRELHVKCLRSLQFYTQVEIEEKENPALNAYASGGVPDFVDHFWKVVLLFGGSAFRYDHSSCQTSRHHNEPKYDRMNLAKEVGGKGYP